jgi:gliding-associated putative ABC transporter substrate-binding component GldG
MPRLERSYRNQALLQFVLGVALLVIINVLAGARLGDTRLYGAVDLTEDKRFTLTAGTRQQLTQLKEPVLVRVLLGGELPASYARLRSAVTETLEDFSGYARRLEYELVDPLAGDPEAVRQRQEDMATDGIIPVTDYQQTAGERTARAIYPYLLIYYGNRQRIVPLLETARPDVPITQQLNQAENLLEYRITRAIRTLTDDEKPLIAFTQGNGELPGPYFVDLYQELRKFYNVEPLYLDSFAAIPQEVELLIVAKPTIPFTDFDAFKLDQYVMNGGKVMWAIDGVGMDYDSLRQSGEFYPQTRTTGLEDLFFRYGFRLGNQLILDLANTPIPIATSQGQGGPKFTLVPFPYHTLALPASEHPVVQNIDAVDTRYPTVIELLDNQTATVTPLLASSDNARRQRLPSPIDLDAQKFSVDLERFNESDLPIAVLLEGSFRSPYANRLSRDNEQQLRAAGMDYRAESPATRMMVLSDGDILANAYSTRSQQAGTLGVNQWSGIPYANKTFLLNAVEYMLNPDGVIQSRSKQVKLRLLDQNRALAEAGYWRVLNLALPLLALSLFGLLFTYIRRRRYAR